MKFTKKVTCPCWPLELTQAGGPGWAINSWHFPRAVGKFHNWSFWTQTGFIGSSLANSLDKNNIYVLFKESENLKKEMFILI